jgi:nicotinate-nucleotide adenylyltransferase
VSANRIGIFGGTFDPIHIGHLAVAERACDELGFERVVFVPALRPPHKPHRTISPIEDRLHMLELAIAGNARFAWSDVDLRPDAPSYTVRMLQRLGAEYPGAELFFIIGGDSLRDFGSWYQPEDILDLATLAVADRPGATIDQRVYEATPGLREKVIRFAAPLLEVSSTALRERVQANKSIRYLVSEPVYRYIEDRELYRVNPVLSSNGL